MIRFELKLVQTSRTVLKHLLQRKIEVIRHAAHIRTIHILKRLISIPQPRAYRLIYKHHIVVLGPAVIVPDNVIGFHVGCHQAIRPALEEVSQLTRGAGTAIKPYDDGVVGDLCLGGVLSAVEDE